MPPRPARRRAARLPNNGADDTRGQLGILLEADGGAGRLHAATLHQHGPNGRPVYVHAKIGVVDDEWLTIGSANLNEHSLFNDTEVNLVVRDPETARAARLRLWREHLERDDVDGDPHIVVDEHWRPSRRPRSPGADGGSRTSTGSCGSPTCRSTPGG